MRQIAVFLFVLSTWIVAAVDCACGQQVFSNSQVLELSDPWHVPSAPFPVSVTWQPDDTLAVLPDWAAFGAPGVFDQMEVPPTIRTEAQGLVHRDLKPGNLMLVTRHGADKPSELLAK